MRADRLTVMLTYATAAVGAGAALFHVSPVVAGILLLAAGFGLAWDLRDQHPLSSWAVNLLAIAGILAVLALPASNGLLGRLLAASTVLMAAKLLSPKANRDRMQIILLSLLLLIGAAVATLSMVFALLFAVYLILAMCYLIWMPFGAQLAGRTAPRHLVGRLSSTAGLLLALTIPVLLVLYFGLPRSAFPLVPGSAFAAHATVGFTDRIRPGDVSEIAMSNEPVFRAVVPTEGRAALGTPYWRGTVFDLTDGRTWARSTRAQQPIPLVTLTNAGAIAQVGKVAQTIYLEPTGTRTMFALDWPLSVKTGGLRTSWLSAALLETDRPPVQRVRYDVESVAGGVLPTAETEETLAGCLELPADLPPILLRTAADVAGSERNDEIKARLILEHFRTAGYTYSLEEPGSSDATYSRDSADPPNTDEPRDASNPSSSPGPAHPLEGFLRTRTGYCESFASAMALMLRSLGVPSRIVGGYVGGEFNSAGGYYLVTQRCAHAWVEAYVSGKGWVRYDPTPAGEGPAASLSVRSSPLSRLIDSLRLRWYSLVIGYDFDRQLSLFKSLSGWLGSRLSWRPSSAGLTALAGFLGLAVIAVASRLLAGRRQGRTEVEQLYAILLGRLGRHGYKRQPSEGPIDFASRLGREAPAAASITADVTQAYVDWRYGGHDPAPGSLASLRRRLRKARLPRRNA